MTGLGHLLPWCSTATAAAYPLIAAAPARGRRRQQRAMTGLVHNVRRHCCLGRLFDLEGVDQDLGGRSGVGRVLAGDQQSVGDDVDTPVFDLGKGGTEAEQFVLDEERHDLGQANIRLLTVGEPGHLLASTSGLPTAVFTWRKTPGAWQTSATGFPAARKDSISLMELGSSARSHIGPWPPG